MRFSKLVSAASALTIAASAFAGLAVTANAADTTTSYTNTYEDDTPVVDWTSGNTGRYTATVAEDSDSGNHYMSIAPVSNGNNGTTVSTNSLFTGTVTAGDDFTVTFDAALTPSTNQYSTTLKLLSSDGYILQVAQNKSTTGEWTINGDDKVTLTSGSWYSYTVVRQGTKTYLGIKDSSGNDVFTKALIPSGSENGGLTGMSFATSRYYAALNIDNVKVRAIEEGDVPSTVYHTVTTKYVYEYTNENDETVQEEIATATTDDVEDGKTYTTTYSDKIYSGDYTYTYSSGAVTDATITADTTYTIKYTRAARVKYSATITAVDSTDSTNVLGTYPGTGEEPETGATISTPKYILKDGTYYAADVDTFTRTLTANITVTYTKKPNVVAYVEDGDFAYSNKNGPLSTFAATNASGGTVTTYQGGSYDDRYMYTTVNITEAGDYTISGYVFGNGRPLNVYVDDGPDSDSSNQVYTSNGTIASGTNISFTSDTVTLTAGEHKIIVSSYSSNLTAQLDYIYVEAVSSASTVDATNVGAFTGDDDSTATAFTAALENSGSVTISGITVTPSAGNGDAKTLTVDSEGNALPTLTNANAVIGIIVKNLSDENATATVTFE